MTKKEYLEKRNKLMNEAQVFIDAKEAEKANEKLSEVETLDRQWEKITNESANNRALNEEPKPLVFPWMSGNVYNVSNGKYYPSALGTEKQMFLTKNYSMVDAVCQEDPDALEMINTKDAFAKVVRGMVTGRWDSPELKNMVTTTSSGSLIPQVLSARIIDIAREISLFSAAGVPVIPMNSNNATISRVKTDPTFKFKKEGEEGNEADFELDGVELKSKTCYGYAYVTLEAIQNSCNLDSILYQVFASAIANCIDKTMLYGQFNGESYDVFAPAGIMNDEEILSVTSGEKASYDDIIKAAGKIANNNGIPSVWAVNSQVSQTLDMLKTTDGQYLTPPKALDSMKKIMSNQLAHDDAKGSDGLVFDSRSMIIGIQNNIQIKIIEDTKCLKNGLVGFQIYSMQDCKVVRPKSICKITGIKTV